MRSVYEILTQMIIVIIIIAYFFDRLLHRNYVLLLFFREDKRNLAKPKAWKSTVRNVFNEAGQSSYAEDTTRTRRRLRSRTVR